MQKGLILITNPSGEMDASDRPNVSSGTSYPSPNVSQIGAGTTPFYHPGQHAMPLTEQLHLSADTHRGSPSVHQNSGGSQGPSHIFRASQASGDSHGPREQYMDVPQQIAQGVLTTSGPGRHDMPNGTPVEGPLQKRSKVSRACDECRRKKVRCDAKSEDPGEQCSSCKRLNQHCQFSRQPLKRGPSKGYIKELAERVGKLEYIAQVPDGQLPTPTLQDSMSQGMLPYSPDPNDTEHPSRKRARSVSSGAAYPESMERLYQETSTQAMPGSTPNYSVPGGPRHQVPESSNYPYQNVASILALDVNRDGHSAPMVTPNAGFNGQHNNLDRVERSGPIVSLQGDRQEDQLDWDDQCIEEYYRLIHPTAPLLPTEKKHLHQYLIHCSSGARVALLHALYTAIQSSPTFRYKRNNGDQALERSFQIASQSIIQLRDQDTSASARSDRLPSLQAMIFMVFATEIVGPTHSKLIYGPKKSMWLSMAIEVAYSLDLHLNKPYEVGSEQGQARSVWLTLVALDRWNSASTSSPLHIADNRIILHQADRVLVGETCFNLTRLALILGHLSEIYLAPASLSSADTFSISQLRLISEILNGELERFRESTFDTISTTPSLGLAYWHVKLLFNRQNRTYVSETNDVIGIALKVAQQLRSADNPPMPLIHHFAALAALTLTEYANVKETQEGAMVGLQTLKEALDNGQVFHDSDQAHGSKGWRSAISDYIAKKQPSASQRHSNDAIVDRGGLQHLADLAVEKSNGYDAFKHTEARQEMAHNEEMDWTMSTKKGYLNAYR